MGLWLALAVAGAGLATAYYDDDSGLRTWWTLRADLRDAAARIEQLRTEVAGLERDSGGLEGDPFVLERAIRERLELALPGETVVRLSPRETATTRIP
jgi:cell division protein FtsB